MNFLNKIEKFNPNICLIKQNKDKILYDQILNKGEQISKDLKNKSLIFVLAKNHVDFFISYISFYRKGLVQMLVDPNISSAVLNEIVWRTQPEATWVNFKVWGLLPISFLFIALQIPLINKYKLE